MVPYGGTALLRDTPLSYPPTGNPRIFGPGRGRNDERGAYVFFWLSLACLFRPARPKQGGGVLSGSDSAVYLLAALVLGATAVLICGCPSQRVIVRVDDHGVSLCTHVRLHARDRTFMSLLQAGEGEDEPGQCFAPTAGHTADRSSPRDRLDHMGTRAPRRGCRHGDDPTRRAGLQLGRNAKVCPCAG
ncbi:hypothetical protein C7455_10766 [Roseicyclus mahoneyensis]|uniref:Uncharacterized protein n=1 Tax=Roseicyclus mahoneyensis TaxID=164332 RepID=A0A316GEU9_9RHOB|nr:hypothetical protein C7455_10766 [Roseicyclus mahoneyensis]